MNPYSHPSYQEITSVPYDVATHLIIGWATDDGGIIGTASDEFTARRWAKLANDAGFFRVCVLPNEAETYLEVAEGISQQLAAAL